MDWRALSHFLHELRDDGVGLLVALGAVLRQEVELSLLHHMRTKYSHAYSIDYMVKWLCHVWMLSYLVLRASLINNVLHKYKYIYTPIYVYIYTRCLQLPACMCLYKSKMNDRR